MTASPVPAQVETGLTPGPESIQLRAKEQLFRYAGLLGRTAVNAAQNIGAGVRSGQNVLRLTAGTTMALMAFGLGYSVVEQYAEERIDEIGQSFYESIAGSNAEVSVPVEVTSDPGETHEITLAQSSTEPNIESGWPQVPAEGLLSIPLLIGGSALIAGSLRDRRDNGSWVKNQTRPATLEDLPPLQADETVPQSGTIKRFTPTVYVTKPYEPYDKAEMGEGFFRRHSHNIRISSRYYDGGLHWRTRNPDHDGMDTLNEIFNDTESPSRGLSPIERVDVLGDRVFAAIGRGVRAGIGRTRKAIAQYRDRLNEQQERAAFIPAPDAPANLTPAESVEWIEQERQKIFVEQAFAGNTYACGIDAGRSLIL